jgi:hypothetical protein
MRLISILDLEDPPAQQLSYSLTKTLFRVSDTMANFESHAERVFVEHLEKCHAAFSSSIDRQGSEFGVQK